MKKFILINLNQTDTKEARTVRWKERGRWMIFTVIVLSLIFANTSLFLIGSGYNRLIAQKENEIADIRQRIRDLQAQGKNLSKRDILSFAELESNRTLWARNFELLGKMTPDAMALTGLKFNTGSKELGGVPAGSTTSFLVMGGYPSSALTESFDGSAWTETTDLNTGRETRGAGTAEAGLAMGGNPVQATTEEFTVAASAETIAFD